MLADRTIKKLAIDSKMVEPFDEGKLSAASYDLSLDKTDKERNIIPPHSATLVVTEEALRLPDNIGAKVISKSSIARIMVSVGDIGGWVDPGYRGQLSLLAINSSDTAVDLNKYGSVCQVVFFETDVEPEKPYNGHYQDSVGVREAWFNRQKQDYRNVDVMTDLKELPSGTLVDKEFFNKRWDF